MTNIVKFLEVPGQFFKQSRTICKLILWLPGGIWNRSAICIKSSLIIHVLFLVRKDSPRDIVLETFQNSYFTERFREILFSHYEKLLTTIFIGILLNIKILNKVKFQSKSVV